MIFSVLSYKSASAVCLIFRTLSTAVALFLYFSVNSIMKLFKSWCDLVNKFGIDNLMKDSLPNDIGMPEYEFYNIKNAASQMSFHQFLVIFIGVFLGTFVYLILSVTSVISLVRQSKASAADGIVTDGEAAAQDGLCANNQQR